MEEAVRRETWEETGIDVGEVTYHSSQPWPGNFLCLLSFCAFMVFVSLDSTFLLNWISLKKPRLWLDDAQIALVDGDVSAFPLVLLCEGKRQQREGRGEKSSVNPKEIGGRLRRKFKTCTLSHCEKDEFLQAAIQAVSNMLVSSNKDCTAVKDHFFIIILGKAHGLPSNWVDRRSPISSIFLIFSPLLYIYSS